MLQAGRDYEYVHAFDEAFGLRELRAKVNGKAGMTDEHPPNRFSINAEFCYGTESVEIVRKYLDSGALVDHLNNKFWNGDRCWNDEDSCRFHVLAACAMTLGCALPEKMRESLEKQEQPAIRKYLNERVSPAFKFKALARHQMKALMDIIPLPSVSNGGINNVMARMGGLVLT